MQFFRLCNLFPAWSPRPWPLLAALCVGLAIQGMLFGQAFTGSISGLVADPSGAAVADVPITVTDVDRNVDYRATTNERGFYLVAPLPPGTYRIVAEKTGFRRFVQSPLPLSTQQKASINITLELGSVTESVQVSGQAQLIESNTSTLSAVVENKRIMDLPLNGRNVYNLVLLVPGVFNERPASGMGEDFWTVTRFSVSGGMEGTNTTFMDGAAVDVPFQVGGYNASSIVPSLEGIQEFRIQTNSYSAEYGRTGGGVVTMVTKSGTNELHGSAYEFLRNSVFDSNGFFANRRGQSLASYKRNEFGASFGGPLSLPKLYSGKNRTFYFASYEGRRVRSGALVQLTHPTELEKAGDFSQTLNAAGRMKSVYNPFTTRPDPARPGSFIRDPFPGNKLPQNLIDPIARKAQSYYPAPNSPGLPFTGQLNFVRQATAMSGPDKGTLKVDHFLTDRQRFFIRYNIRNAPTQQPDGWGDRSPACPNYYCIGWVDRQQNVGLDYTNTLSSSTLVNLRYSIGRGILDRNNWNYGFKISSLGFPEFIEGAATAPIFPNMAIQDYTMLGTMIDQPYKSSGMTHGLVGNLTKVVGGHTLKFGSEVRILLCNFYQGGTTPNVSFTRAMTQGPDARTPSDLAGVGYASFLLGTGASGSFNVTPRTSAANRYFGFYAQDDYKVNRKLSVNLGLRWDIETGMTERYNRFQIFDPYVTSPASKTVGFDVRGGYLFPGVSLGRRNLVDLYLRQINPRFGFAYQFRPSIVIRSGYGIFFAPPRWSARSAGGSAFNTSTSWVTSLDGVTPYRPLNNAFADGLSLPEGSVNGLMAKFGQSGGGTIPQYLAPPPYNQQWNFTVQWGLAKDMVTEIAYVGNKGTHVPFSYPSYELNQMNTDLLSMGSRLLELVSNPFYGLVALGTMAQAQVQRGQLLRPYPQVTSVTAGEANVGNSNYHSLQARFEKRFSAGTSFMLSYTWSKWIADGSDGLWMREFSIRNWNCRRCERSLNSADQPQRLVANFTYELPFGRGKSLGAGWNHLADAILGQWQVNGIMILSSGLPLPFMNSQNTSYSFGGGQHPDSTGVDADLGGSRTIDRWFDTSQFKLPAPYTFGTVGRTHPNLRQAGYRNLDFSIFKMYRIKERAQVQFRAEAFNFPNHPLFSPPDSTFGSPNFGMVTGQGNSPRQLQFALKILF